MRLLNRARKKSPFVVWYSHMSRFSIGVTGVRVKGRDKIEAALEKFFSENKGAQIEVEPADIVGEQRAK